MDTDRKLQPAGQGRDLRLDRKPGTIIETRRYGIAPNGDLDDWVILCTVRGARGPFTEQRTVTYGAWQTVDIAPPEALCDAARVVLIGRDNDGDLVWRLPDGRWTWGNNAQEAVRPGRTFDPDVYVRRFGMPVPD